jgi:hypothetical protein
MSGTDTERAPAIAWEEAEVHDGELHVGLDAEAPRGWASRFRAVLARLSQEGKPRWGRISVSRREIRVAEVDEGGEEDLRHLLESVLRQVNADLAPEEQEAEEPASPEQQRDARMTDAFRGFGGGE